MGIPLEAYPLVIGGILLVFVDVFVLLNVIKVRVKFEEFSQSFEDPSKEAVEKRQRLFGEIAHGVMRALSERQGALKGAASRAVEGQLQGDVTGLAISGLANFLPKKYQAFAPLIAPYIQQFLERQGGAQLLTGQASTGGQNGQPP